MSHDEPRLQLHAYLKSLSGYRGAPLHVDLCFYVCNPKKSSTTPKSLLLLLKYTGASRKRVTHTRAEKLRDKSSRGFVISVVWLFCVCDRVCRKFLKSLLLLLKFLIIH